MVTICGCIIYTMDHIQAATRENRSLGFPTRSDINRPVQPQKQARGLKFWIYIE